MMQNFDDLELPQDLLRGVYAHGFEKPSYVQQRALPLCLKGKDIIIQGQSGMGKTATFAITALAKVDRQNPSVQILILVPTRELAVQTDKELTSLCSHMKNKVIIYTAIGGLPIKKDVARMSAKGAQILIGTAGRMADIFRRELIPIKNIKMLIVDEADEMLLPSQGFKGHTEHFLKTLRKGTQKILLSATMPQDILKEAKKLLDHPHAILVRNEELTLEGIKQYYVNIEEEYWKFDTFLEIFELLPITRAIVFCNERSTVEFVERRMREEGQTGFAAMHGKMDQSVRSQLLRDFRVGKLRVLITTDLCGRGIDIQQIALVINYDLPTIEDRKTNESYIHRIGRGGRFGREGVALSFVTTKELETTLVTIQEMYATKIVEMPFDLDEIF